MYLCSPNFSMNMQEDKSIIEVSHVSKYFGEKTALDDVTLNVKKGEFVTILGPSGCGKTTLLRLIAGFQTASEGEIRISGKEITQTPPHKRPVNTVFQKYALFPHLNVYDNIAFGPRTHGVKGKAKLDDMVEEALRKAAIWDEVKDRLDKSALSFSGGQQQRLCIARALAVQPEVLLMDEPTSALDPISTLKIEDLALELKQNYTIVIVTHNMQQAVRISDKTAFFLLGEVVEFNDTDTLFSNPQEKKTEDYITGRFG